MIHPNQHNHYLYQPQIIIIAVVALVLFSHLFIHYSDAAPPPQLYSDGKLISEQHRSIISSSGIGSNSNSPTNTNSFPHLHTINNALLHHQQQQHHQLLQIQAQQPQLHHQHLQQQQNFIINNNQNSGNYTWAMHEILLDLRQQMLTKSIRFDEHFRNLLSISKRSLHNMFTETYGMMYEKNTEIFTSMFESLEQYYANGQINLQEAMKAFFERLYQKIFQVFNNHLSFPPSYLECATEQLARLKPFKDVPDKLVDEITQSFVAARTLNQALNGGIDVIKGIISLGQSSQCIKLINEKLLKNNLIASTNQQQQQATSVAQPCLPFCESVITKCIGRSNLDLLNKRWTDYVLALNDLATKLSTSYNIETIIAPLDVQISEAIMNFQENAPNISSHVFQACGNVRSDLHSLALQSQQQQSNINSKLHVANRLGKRAAAAGTSSAIVPTTVVIANYTNSPSALVADEVRRYLLSTAYFWSSFPNAVCTSNYTLGTKKQLNCFSEPLTLADANMDMRFRVEINHKGLHLENMRRKIESALKGSEIDWTGNGGDDLLVVGGDDDKGQVMSGAPALIGGGNGGDSFSKSPSHLSITSTTTSTPSLPSASDSINGDDDTDDTDGDDDDLHEPGSGESEFDSTTEGGGLDSEENLDDFEGTESGSDLSDDDDLGTDSSISNQSPSEPSSTEPNNGLDNGNAYGSDGSLSTNGLTPLINEDIATNQITNPLNQPDAQKSGQTSSKLVIRFESKLLFGLIISVATWYHHVQTQKYYQ